ncbi:MAG: DUF3999 domain-containing protein [bacterium]|nr:DUF3999 domain-containing protein [bacterium]
MRALLLGFSFGFLAAVCNAETPADFATGITLETTGKEAFYRVELPLAVHAQARTDLADVRIFNGKGEAVPYALGAWRDADTAAPAPVRHDVARFPLKGASVAALAGLDITVEQNRSGKVIALKSSNATAATAATSIIAFVFDAASLDQDSQALLLDWPATADGYSAETTLETSDDLKTWHYLASAPLLDMRYGGQQLAQKRIAFTRGRYRYLRLSADQPLPVFSLAQIESVTDPAPAAPPLRWQNITASAGEKTGDYVFDSGAWLPVSRIGLQLAQTNTVAPVELLVRNRPDAPWRHVLNTVSYRLTRNGRDITSPLQDINPHSGRYWLLHVDPRAGGLGSGMPRLTLGWSPRQLVFVARGDGPFTLAFGKRDARPAQLPLASLLPGYVAGAETALPAATLGASRVLGGRDAGPESAVMNWKKLILWSVLVLGTGFLAWMARSLIRQMNAKE